ncbi:M28 family peptidase [Dactylosporangium sp. NBC_01737]|uniref:M28 family peptidase n=1 Tax=Dactylosporangium sp. NBC_01737 TaxID=2975959 RepID=UPI002E130E2E|nr:M28 family peptidase [Dactylosporangium sp. NBC_01737]
MVSRSVRRFLGAATAAILVGSIGLTAPAEAHGGSTITTPKQLTKAVTLPGVLRHLLAFQLIGDLNGGNRASGTPGHRRSADYVAALLQHAGYQVTRQPFQFNFCDETSSSFAQTAPVPATYVEGTDYDLMTCSGSGDVTAAVVPVDLNLVAPRVAVTSGCEAADFTATPVTGRIALMQRGGCPFGTKVANAEAAGAVGAIVMNQGNGDPATAPDRYSLLLGTLGAPVGIPAVGVSYGTGEAFSTTPGLTVHLTASTIAEIRDTENVIAETKTGKADTVVMAGAHLDSVPEGNGINDNGSGSAALLETALQMAKTKPVNKLRFAWWGAEEANLVGSTFYVGGLTPQQQAQIKLYLNFDMVASPNYMFGVYDGDDSAAQGSGPGPAGSAQIEKLFEAFFASRGQSTNAADFTGRSDYGPFIAAGVNIPAGGLFTGAEGIKTAADVAKYGGVADVAYDPCYHDPCDDLFRVVQKGGDAALYGQLRSQYLLVGNINTFALDTNADAIATAVITYAFDTSSIPPRTAAPAAARSAAPTADGQLSQ